MGVGSSMTAENILRYSCRLRIISTWSSVIMSSWVCSSKGTSSSNLLLMIKWSSRHFSSSRLVLKKAKGKAAAEPVSNSSSGSNAAPLDLGQLKSQLENSKSLFAEKLKEIKAGGLNQKKFHSLAINTGDAETPLGQLATIATRGNKLSIVAYDPNHVKHIRTAIVSELGVPAESGSDAQTLSVNLASSGDKAAEQQKQIKAEFEHFKNSSSRHSLSSIRNKYLTTLKKQKEGKSKEQQLKDQKQVEETVKQYTTLLQGMLK